MSEEEKEAERKRWLDCAIGLVEIIGHGCYWHRYKDGTSSDFHGYPLTQNG